MKLFFAVLLLLPLFIFLSGAVIKLLWWACGVGDWTGLGALPWGPAIFIGMVCGKYWSSK